MLFNPLSANPTKWSNALKQFVGNLQKGQFTCRCRECVKDQVWGFSLATPSRRSIFFPITVWKNVTKIRQWRRSSVLLLTLNKKNIVVYSSKSSALTLGWNYWYFQTNCLSVFDHFVKLALKGLTFDLVKFAASSYW